MKRMAVAVAVIALAVPIFTGSSQARSLKGYCQDFANIATNQYRKNLQKRCGFSGGQWHGNYKAHYHWCMKAGANQAQRVLNGHQAALKRCGGGGGGGALRSYCQEYARYSAKQGGKNQQYRCGFSGGGWHTNYNMHYNWCMRAGQYKAKAAMKERSKMLDRCKGGGFYRGPGGQPGGGPGAGPGGPGGPGGGMLPPPNYRGALQGWCQQYSARAMGQVQRMFSMNCKYGGPLWVSDGAYHFRRCMSIGQGGAQNEERQRDYMLTNCGRRF